MMFIQLSFLFCRQEKINVRSLRGQAKVFGTVINVYGATVMTFYRGPKLRFLLSGVKSHQITHTFKPNILLGSILVFVGVVVWSAYIAFQVIFTSISVVFIPFTKIILLDYRWYDWWNSTQAPVLKRYPTQLSLTALATLVSAVESALIGVLWEYKNINFWAIGWNMELLSVVYSVSCIFSVF